MGIEDEDKAKGRDRVYGIQENPESVDELKRLIGHRVTPSLAPPNCNVPTFVEIGCTLRDGDKGSIVVVNVEKSNAVHSIVDGGTFNMGRPGFPSPLWGEGQGEGNPPPDFTSLNCLCERIGLDCETNWVVKNIIMQPLNSIDIFCMS